MSLPSFIQVLHALGGDVDLHVVDVVLRGLAVSSAVAAVGSIGPTCAGCTSPDVGGLGLVARLVGRHGRVVFARLVDLHRIAVEVGIGEQRGGRFGSP